MSVLPEEFPVILTIFLALGAWRMSRIKVLTRRMPVLEMLGAATVLCVDKTGTLTRNQMTVSRLQINGESLDLPGPPGQLPEQFHRLMEYAILASQRDPFDPMERAIRELGSLPLANTEHVHGDWTLVQEYPLSRRLLAMSHVWSSPDGREYAIAAKGAPEAIAELCHFSPAQRDALSPRIEGHGRRRPARPGSGRGKIQLERPPGGPSRLRFFLPGVSWACTTPYVRPSQPLSGSAMMPASASS